MLNHPTLYIALFIPLLLMACGEDFSGAELQGEIPFDSSARPTAPISQAVAPYTGDDPIVLTAQERIRTGLDLHRKLIWRTCTPNGGVCHNQKEYPDMHTPSNFLATIGAPCNVSPGEWQSVFDRCEQIGDRFNFGGSGASDNEIGYLELISGTSLSDEVADNIGVGYKIDRWLSVCVNEGPEVRADDVVSTDDCIQDFGLLDADLDGLFEAEELPGLHLYLHDPIASRDRDYFYTTGLFIRTFINNEGNVEELPFFNFETRWNVIDAAPSETYPARTHIYARVRNYQLSSVNELLSVGVVQGDFNRNGSYGARLDKPVSEIVPGNPERSYIVARMRGVMLGDEIPGTRMPLANQPFSVDEMLAFYCFIEGLPDAELSATLDWPIDYNKCSFAADPSNLNLLGEGVSWTGRVQKILEFNCGGCHAGSDPPDGLNLVNGNVYELLLDGEGSKNIPGMKFIVPGEPDSSYLWLKLIGDPSIVGKAMPYNPLTGAGALSDTELADLKQWIINGATID